MNCICGCGTQLRGSDAQDLNLKAGEIALELIAWDRARALGSPVAAAEVAEAIASGAPRYQALLELLHGSAAPSAAAVREAKEDAGTWIQHSQGERRRVHEVFPAVPKKRIRLSGEEEARVDRRHPELTFTAVPTAFGLELGSVLQAARDEGADFEPLAVGWLGRLIAADPPTLDQLRWLLGRLEDARSGRIEEAEPALRRFLAERE